MEKLFLVYIKYLSKKEDGKDEEGKKAYKYTYEFFFSETPDVVWGVDWEVNNPSICTDLTPEQSTYSKVIKVETPLPLKTIEDITCYSMEYAIPGIIALAWINIDGLSEYPENGRMVFHFGDSLDKVKELLALYGVDIEL